MELSILLQSALDAFPNVIIINQECRVVYITHDYEKMLGMSKTDIIGKHVTEVIPNTKLHGTVKSGKAQFGAVMSFYDHEQKKDIKLVCNRIPLFQNNQIIGAVAMTTFKKITEVYSLYKKLEKAQEENEFYKKTLHQIKEHQNPLSHIIGSTPEIMELKQTVADFAKSNLSILLTGETGVGKEVFASAIHSLSTRSLNTYVKVNCAAIPKDLLESELFGYEGGSFTGALKHGKIGKFELADGGTLLLDEIGEMPLSLQAKLLRVLQEKEVERIGSLKPKKINVRIICSTNQNLPQLVREGKFREDLYYRINTIELCIPPLRERLDDLPDLCNFFIQKNNTANGSHTQGILPEVISLFRNYRWPGNVRELEHIIERLAFLHQNDTISLEHCGFLYQKIRSHQPNDLPFSNHTSLQFQKEKVEKQTIINALSMANGNKSKAAKILEIDRSRLYQKIKKYHIQFPS